MSSQGITFLQLIFSANIPTPISWHLYPTCLTLPLGLIFTCLSLKDRLFLVRTFWLYLIIIKLLFFVFSLLVVLAWGFIFVLFLTNSFLSVLPAYRKLSGKRKKNPKQTFFTGLNNQVLKTYFHSLKPCLCS